VFGDLIRLIRRPIPALTCIDRDRPLALGLIALGLSVALPAAVAEPAALGPYRPSVQLGSLPSLTAQGADLYARWSYANRFLLPIYGLLISVLLWVIAVALIHAIVRALHGRGTFSGFVKLAGYIAFLGILALPFQLLDAATRLAGNGRAEQSAGQLAGLIGVGIFVWQNALLIYAAREHYRISTERAVAAVLGPIGGVAVVLVALVIVAAVLVALGQSA
jgi:hypothetical protein